MKCENVMYLMVLYLNGEIDVQEKLELENHVQECQSCRQEFAHMKLMHQQLGVLPVPQPNTSKMQADFYEMLHEYKRATMREKKSWLSDVKEKFEAVWQPVYAAQLIMGFLLLLMGWAGGYWLRPEKSNDQQLSQLTKEVQQMRETMLLSMLEKPAATDRLKAVNYTQNLDRVDEKVIGALLQTLNNDPNVNVRLVTVEALHQLADHPKVREGLIASITQQDSPLVQIALADVMVDLQEKKSVEQLQRLLEQKDLDETVKSRITETVNILL